MTEMPPTTLSRLRAEIDAIDDELHDLLMRRSAVIEAVARDGGKSGVKIRPGREAAMLRRLLARHQGQMPSQTILRLWREMFAGALIIEGGQTIAVCDGDEAGADRLALAREHFGPLTPMRRHGNPAQTLADLLRETAQVAVLPPPGEGDNQFAGWWTGLVVRNRPGRLSIIARLPFWTQRLEGTPLGEAYVVAAMRPDPSGNDRGLVAFEFGTDISRARLTTLLHNAGLAPEKILIRRQDTHAFALVEVAGLLEDNDPRLAALGRAEMPAIVIGGYALPLGETP